MIGCNKANTIERCDCAQQVINEWCRCSVGNRRDGTLVLTRIVNVVEIEDLGIHHNLPGVDREISIVERPVERLLSFGLVGRVVVRGEVRMCERFCSADTGSWVEDQHLFEQVESHWVGVLEFLRERHALALGQRLDESKRVLGANGLDDLVWWGAKKLGDDRELVDVEKGFMIFLIATDVLVS